MQTVRNRLSDFFWLMAGALCMLIIAPIAIESWAWLRAWDAAKNPPVVASLLDASMISNDTMRVRLTLTRHEDCDFVRLVGFTGPAAGPLQLATMLRREDGAAPISYPMGVPIISQPWVISPVYGPRLMLLGYYDCDERLVRTKLVDEVVK
jgi:hypothetical protein